MAHSSGFERSWNRLLHRMPREAHGNSGSLPYSASACRSLHVGESLRRVGTDPALHGKAHAPKVLDKERATEPARAKWRIPRILEEAAPSLSSTGILYDREWIGP